MLMIVHVCLSLLDKNLFTAETPRKSIQKTSILAHINILCSRQNPKPLTAEDAEKNR